jgi:N-acetylglucosamine-6-phosphate deacetylase
VEGVFRAAQMLGCPWQDTWKRFSETPAKLIGLRNELEVGQPATFCVLKTSDAGKLLDLRVCKRGEW